ncbi:MAG: hypothetical protein KAR07_10085 [Spirochaetes bacterium]|nr:hypothetical protein [Spirochaetota bacterium]
MSKQIILQKAEVEHHIEMLKESAEKSQNKIRDELSSLDPMKFLIRAC